MRQERINEIFGIFYLLLGLFTLASLIFFKPEDIPFYTSHAFSPVQNYTGVVGAYVAFGLVISFGLASYFIPILFLIWSGCYFTQCIPEKKIFKVVGLAIALISTAILIAVTVSPELRFDRSGAVGYLAGTHLLRYLGKLGSYILAGACLMLSLLLATDFLLFPMTKGIFSKMAALIKLVTSQLDEIREAIGMFFQGIRERREQSHLATAEAKQARQKFQESKKAKNKKEVTAEDESSALPEVQPKIRKYRPDISESEIEDKVQNLKGEVAATAEAKAEAAKALKRRTISIPRKSASDISEDESGKHDGVIGLASDETKVEYQFPSIDLLEKPVAATGKGDDLQANTKIIEETLGRFSIKVKVVEVEQGPTVTRYELLPAPGVKVNSISALSDDLALALKARSIRLIIPIPGKSAVGVEVPNTIKTTVTLREMIESQTFKSKKAILPMILGKDTSGKDMIADLASMPHMLIAGSTGSGKSVCINSIVTGLLYHATPDDLKFVMIDPKMVELNVFNKIPHMLAPVVTDVKKAAATLNWVVNEMENRYKLLAAVGVRNIDSFNSRILSEEARAELEGKEASPNVVPLKLPYIVVIVDELADLMMQQADKVEGAIARLAQLARAVGIHLILATQRPSVDVITGVIKANFPARVAFKVSSKVDSRTVLDANGADKLLGRGDLLFMKPGDEKAHRGQAPYVSDIEINAIVDHWMNQGNPDYHPEIEKVQTTKTTANGADEKDELFNEAVQVILETKQASTSNLQRRMRIGYTRAARIIDQIEAEGMIGPVQGAKAREIYITPEDIEQPVGTEEG